MTALRPAPTKESLAPPIAISRELVRRLKSLRFGPPVTCVYNPLDYARESYEAYMQMYGTGPREILMSGMNPGPWGMAQTGVPFGEVNAVRDWLGIKAEIRTPSVQHPNRPIQGFECLRSEVSGQRVWGWAKERFGTPQKFFKRFLIINYCPLCFMEESGRNLTPDKLPAREREPLIAACDAALRKTVEFYQPKIYVAVGGFAEQRARVALNGLNLKIVKILHPSPASPAANRGWAQQVEKQLQSYEIRVP